MPSDVRQPLLADTPHLFARIEAGLREEATAVRAGHDARMRRAPWYQALRPVMGLAVAALALLLAVPTPLTSMSLDAPIVAIAAATDVASGEAQASGFLHRLPSDDVAAIATGSYRHPRPSPAADMLRLAPA